MTDETTVPNGAIGVARSGPASRPGAETSAPAPEVAAPGEFWRRLRRFFWMGEQMAEAVKHRFRPGQPGWYEYRLARSAQIGASQCGESGEESGSAFLLDRAAVTLLVRAHLARAGSALPPSSAGEARWAHLADLPAGSPLLGALSEEQRGLVMSALGGQGGAFLAKLPPAKRKLAAHLMASLAKGLSDPLDRDVGREGAVLFLRWTKILLALLVVVGGPGLAISKAMDRPNLALHRPVTVVNPHPEYGRDPSLLVDGDLTNLGFHTIEASNQNVTIDLGRVQRISRVVVYNRSDCCQERAVPLDIEVSENGVRFRQVAERKAQFAEWKANFKPTGARYVRLNHPSAVAFHLSEVEVY